MKVYISVHGGCGSVVPLPRPAVARVVSAMLGASPCPWLEVELHCVRDGHMAQLNTRHMGCSGPTNVLSFPSSQNPQQDQPAEGAVATLVLAVDTLRREAFLYGQDPEEYMVWLLAHGMGHLMGYDHGSAMNSLCAELFSVGMESLVAAEPHSAGPEACLQRFAPCCAIPALGG